MGKFDSKAILEDADIESVLSFCNVKTRRIGGTLFMECPGHMRILGKRDRNLSNCYIKPNGRAYCTACNWSGRLFDVVMETQGVSFPKACEIVSEISTGNAEMYRNQNGTSEDEISFRNNKEFFTEIGLTGDAKRRPGVTNTSGCLLNEVFSQEEADAYYESGYRIEKTDNNSWLIFTKDRLPSLLSLKKGNEEIYEWLISEKIKEKEDFLNELKETSEYILDPLFYSSMQNEIDRQKKILENGRGI